MNKEWTTEMWIFLNNSFLSVIDPKAKYTGGGGPVSSTLLVRSRIKGDIEAVFPKAIVTETPDRDYRFRASIPREKVAEAMLDAVNGIDYSNFKGSVPDKARHDAYAGVWGVMHREQERRVQPPRKQAQRGLLGDDYGSGRVNRR
jgi:hypothetical protein